MTPDTPRPAAPAAIETLRELAADFTDSDSVSYFNSYHGKLKDIGRQLKQCADALAAAPTPPAASEGADGGSDALIAERAKGRAEAYALLLAIRPDDFCDRFFGSHAVGDTGDFEDEWEPKKLREFLRCDDSAWRLTDHAEGLIWERAGLLDEARATSERIQSHDFSKLLWDCAADSFDAEDIRQRARNLISWGPADPDIATATPEAGKVTCKECNGRKFIVHESGSEGGCYYCGGRGYKTSAIAAAHPESAPA